jgi:hypothetical protein
MYDAQFSPTLAEALGPADLHLIHVDDGSGAAAAGRAAVRGLLEGATPEPWT